MIVVHIITGLKNGGAEAVLYRLVQADRNSAHHVVSLTCAGFYGARLVAAGVATHILNMPAGRFTRVGLQRLDGLLRSIKPDVVQTWMYHADLLGGILAHLAGCRTVIWGVHHSDLNPARNTRAVRLLAYTCAVLSRVLPARIVCCSYTSARVHSEIGYDRCKLRVIANGVDLAKFAPNPSARDALRRSLGVAPEEVLLGMVGRWDPLKDHANLISALRHLRASGTVGWRCILVGDGITEENSALTAILRKYAVEDLVMLLGPRLDVVSVMNALDLHVLPSAGEAFGNVTVEAMACGVPAVVTAVGAGEWIVGSTGWVVPPRNPRALADAVCAALAARQEAGRWAERQRAARQRVVDNFSVEKMADAYRTVWRQARSFGPGGIGPLILL